MRVIARRTLIQFVESLKGQAGQKAAKAALDAWFHSGDRVVFNLKGNDYRMVTAIDYKRRIVFIKWLGPHRDYDKIDPRTVQYAD